jgi:hypothetical protein
VYLKQSLNSLPKEYFLKDFHSYSEPYPSGNLWFLFCFLGVFLLFIPSVFALPEMFPRYVVWFGRGLALLYASYIILCIAFDSKKKALRHPIAYLISLIIGLSMFLLFLWLFLSELYMMGMGWKVESVGNVIVTIAALVVLIEGVVIHLLMFRKVKKKIFEGCFKSNGGGLKNNFAIPIIRISRIAVGVMLVLLAILFVLSILSSFKFYDMSDSIIVAFLATVLYLLVLNVMFLVFSLLNVMLIIQAYCIKRFGVPKPPEQRFIKIDDLLK